MTRKQILISVAVVAVLAIGGGAAWYFLANHEGSGASDTNTVAKSSGPLPTPVVLVIDRAAILQASKAGQDMGRQVQEYAQQARAELDPQGKALQAEEQSLKSQLASLSADARQSRVAAFEAKRDAFQRAATIKQNRIKLGLANAQHQMERALEPILKQIMIDRKANMIVDKQAVVFATDTSFDVSRDAVNRLDAVLPNVKVDLPPESAVTAQQQQQPQQ